MMLTIFKKKSDVKGGTHRQGGQDLQRDVPTDGVEAYGTLHTGFFPKFFDFRRRGPESGANGFLEAFRFFAGGNGMAWR